MNGVHFWPSPSELLSSIEPCSHSGVFVAVGGTGVSVAVRVDVAVWVAVVVCVEVGTGECVGVAVAGGHGGMLADFAVESDCSTRMVFTPARTFEMSSGP